MRKKSKKSLAHLRAQMQNWVALAIVLSGAFVGSLFVDVVQMMRHAGFSDRAVATTSVLSYDGRTWVAYREPIVPVTVIADEACAEKCHEGELIAWVQYTIPTVRVRIVGSGTEEGQALLRKYDLVQVPSLLFDSAVKRTKFFASAPQLFRMHEDVALFDLPLLQIVPLRYVRAPRAEHAFAVGSPTAETTVRIVGNFACTECQELHASIVRMREKYSDALRYTFLPVRQGDSDERGERALEAAYCAQAQGVLMPYMTQLFETYRLWQRTRTDKAFVQSARRVGMPRIEEFAQCLRDGTMRQKRQDVERETASLGTMEMPLVFINDAHIENFTDIKSILEEVIAQER